MRRIFWIVLLSIGTAGCAEVDGQIVPTFLQPHPPAAAPHPGQDANTARCIRGEQAVCDMLAVYEVGLWRQNPGLLSTVTSDHLEDLATKTSRACSENAAFREMACLASRRVLIERKLREAEAVGALPVSARGWLTGNAYSLDMAEAQADNVLNTAKLHAAEQEAKHSQWQAARDAEKARQDAADAALSSCQSDVAGCQRDCAATPGLDKCYSLASLYFGGDPSVSKAGPNLARARDIAQRCCAAGNQVGCTVVANMGKQVDDSWAAVVEPGDALSQKVQLAESMTKLIAAGSPSSPRLRFELPSVLAFNRQFATTNFCPAKKQFIQQAGAAEFQARASTHCKDDPPQGTNLNMGVAAGVVRLTSECQAVFRTACP